MSESDEQRLVRQRDRFVCQVCGKSGEQYAHIIPDSEGGAYKLENLVLLCYDHHNYWLESARAGNAARAKTQAVMQGLRGKLKEDHIYSRLFAWPAGDHVVVDLGGGFKFIDHDRILESSKHPGRPYLSLKVNDLGILVVNAVFDDQSGNEFMTVKDNALEVDTISAWDIVVTRRRFSLIYKNQKIVLNIAQNDNLDLVLTGSFFINGGYFEISEENIHDVSHNNWLSNNQSYNGGHGLLLRPGTITI